jgi:hypothetical protein
VDFRLTTVQILAVAQFAAVWMFTIEGFGQLLDTFSDSQIQELLKVPDCFYLASKLSANRF